MAATPLDAKLVTPLPTTAAAVSIPPQAAALPGLKAELKTATDEATAAIAAQVAAGKQAMAAGWFDVVGEASAYLNDAAGELGNGLGAAQKAASKAVGAARGKMSEGLASLWAEGVQTPLGGAEMAAVGSADPGALMGRFGINTNPPVVPPPPLPVAPPINIPPGLTGCIPDLDPVLDVNGLPTCPLGWTLVRNDTGSVSCIPVDQANACTPHNWPPVVPPPPPPPPVPPPVSPPVSPPTSPPPPPPPPGSCTDPGPTTQVSCGRVTKPPPKPVYWVSWKCVDACTWEYCIYAGVNPPTQVEGTLLPGSYLTPPTQQELSSLALQCGFDVVPPPPPPAAPPIPPPPPAVPPPPPVVCDDPVAAAIKAIVNPFAPVAACTPPPTETLTTDAIKDASWRSYGHCTTIHSQIIKGLQSGPLDFEHETQAEQDQSLLKWVTDQLKLSNIVSALVGTESHDLNEEQRKRIDDSVGSLTQGAASVSESIIQALTHHSVTNPKAVYRIGLNLAAANVIENNIRFPMSYLMTGQTYLMHYASPMYIPQQADLDFVYLRNSITADQWECYTKANGNIPHLFDRIRDAKGTKPNVAEVVSLYRRGTLKTEADYTARLRELGVLDKGYGNEYLTLTEQLPQQQDLIRFMVRDVFDKDVVTKYGLDIDFDKKWPGAASAYGRSIGVSDDVQRLQWRAHWLFPSDTANYLMVQRLYPGRPEVVEWDDSAERIGVQATIAAKGKRPPTFDVDDLKEVLQVTDNVPGMIDRLIAISYRPITNTDAERMFELGYIDEDKLRDLIQRNGYTPADSKQIAGYYAAEKRKRISNVSGVWTVRKIVAAFKEGLLDRETADRLLADIVVDSGSRVRILDGANLEVEIQIKRERLKAARKNYVFGLITGAEAAAAIVAAGVPQARAAQLLDQWDADKFGHRKEPRVQFLCTWWTQGIITTQQYADRLARLGYVEEDAANIMKSCMAQSAAKKAAAAAAAAHRAKIDMSRVLRDAKTEADIEYKQMQTQYEDAKRRYEEVRIAEEKARLEKLLP